MIYSDLLATLLYHPQGTPSMLVLSFFLFIFYFYNFFTRPLTFEGCAVAPSDVYQRFSYRPNAIYLLRLLVCPSHNFYSGKRCEIWS